MTYEEATKKHGTIIRPIDAANILGVKRPSINDYWKSGTLTKIEVETKNTKGEMKITNFVSQFEIYKLKEKREERKK